MITVKEKQEGISVATSGTAKELVMEWALTGATIANKYHKKSITAKTALEEMITVAYKIAVDYLAETADEEDNHAQ